jgi:hypothetical protein
MGDNKLGSVNYNDSDMWMEERVKIPYSILACDDEEFLLKLKLEKEMKR